MAKKGENTKQGDTSKQISTIKHQVTTNEKMEKGGKFGKICLPQIPGTALWRWQIKNGWCLRATRFLKEMRFQNPFLQNSGLRLKQTVTITCVIQFTTLPFTIILYCIYARTYTHVLYPPSLESLNQSHILSAFQWNDKEPLARLITIAITRDDHYIQF